MSFQKYFTGKEADSFSNAIKKLDFPQGAKFVRMEQIHGARIAEVDIQDVDAEKETIVQGVDALFTNEKNVFLSVKSADCLPILIHGVGTLNNAPAEFIAVAHAGRKSTQAKLLYKLLEKLDEKYKFIELIRQTKKSKSDKIAKLTDEPVQFYIWFGPAICVTGYQIDRETDLHYDLMSENNVQLYDFFKQHDLHNKSAYNLEIDNGCTLHEPEKYYSYRLTGPGVKMNYSFIGII